MANAQIVGAVVLANDHVAKDDNIVGNKGFGGQGVMPVPNVYNGWVQELPVSATRLSSQEHRDIR